MRRLVAVAETALTLFRERILPVTPIPKERVQQLLADLDSPRYAVRNAAFGELQRVVDQVEPQLHRHAAAAETSAEARRQIRQLRERAEEPRVDAIVWLRALEVLEQIDTPAARALLAEWAAGAPTARFTQEAQSALERMKKR